MYYYKASRSVQQSSFCKFADIIIIRIVSFVATLVMGLIKADPPAEVAQHHVSSETPQPLAMPAPAMTPLSAHLFGPPTWSFTAVTALLQCRIANVAMHCRCTGAAASR